ncbi:ATP-binding protein [Staphylococcus saprophyticus]|nr:DNA replication protein DnaC [Staphylococcus saprophyticus]QKQ09081.1 ATP-binding protein [Staphylococcus saprophyticus]QKQ11472.1 ATP-binding protein [Staphylococcus saprophyticus]RIO30508.1 DNA replication protein DnaC [Staphylococcus saprophyticus]
MTQIGNVARKLRENNPKISRVIIEKLGITCDKCKHKYDYYKFACGYEYKDGCTCESNAQLREAKLRRKNAIESQKVKRMFKYSHVNDEIKKATFDEYIPTNEIQQKAKTICERYVENFDLNNKQSLILTGSCGIGKSHLAMSIAKEVMVQRYTALFLNVQDAISMFRSTYSNNSSEHESELLKIIKSVDLMVIDDYGIKLNDYGMGKLFQILESRVDKHNIITTNLRLEEMTNGLDSERIFSRMIKNATVLELSGIDYRLKNLKVIR